MNHLFLLRKAPWPKFWEGVSVVTTGVFLLLSGPAVADESLAVKTLKEQAKFWETKGRYDLAAPAWTRLLQIDPKNSEAIAGLAQYELTNNRPEAAQAMVEVLKKQPEVNAAVIKRIENLALQQSLNPRQLDQAREAARAGKPEEAVSLYRQLLGGRAPPRSLAVEYLQTLGGTSSGWEEARNGFERLRVEDPSSLEVQLAYAQHLTYRAATRREGIRLLSQLSRTSQVGSSALDAWKRALTWLDASPSDTPLYQSYLKLQPNDSVIKERVASLNQAAVPRLTDPRSSALRDGYAALDAGDVADAEKRFEGLLVQAPKNSDALGGLGVVRLKQKRFAEAENLLAAAARTGGAAKWAESLNTSRFWRAMEEGQVRQDEQHFDLANEAFSRAQKLDPSALEPKIARFWVLERLGRFDEAKNVLSTIKDSTQQREANQLLIKRKVRNAMEAKDYVEVERLLSDSTAQVDVETLELLAWARYHQGNFVLAVSGFAEAYKRSTTKDAAAGLVYSSHKLKEYQQILEILKNDAGPLRELVSLSVQQKMTQGENRFELDSNGRLHELDPVSLLNDDVLWPATLAFEREKNYKKAYDLLLPYEDKLVQIGDYTALATLAQAAALVGDKETELRAFQKAAEGSEEEVFFSFWSQALKKYGRYSEAEAVLLKIAKNLDAPNLISLGWVQYELKKYEQAALRFAESYAKEPTEFAASGLVHSAHKANKLSVILPALEKHPGGPLDLLVPADIRSQIASNENKFWVDARGQVAVVRGGDNSEREGLVLKFEPHLRGKSGEAGGGRLRQSGLVVTLSWQGEAYRASLEVTFKWVLDELSMVA